MSINSKNTLPPDYIKHRVINLRKDKRYVFPAFLINVVTFIFSVVFMYYRIPFITLFRQVEGIYSISVPRLLLNLIALFLGLLFSAIIHLGLKGVTVSLLTLKKPQYGIRGWFIYAGSEVYISCNRYVLLTLLPDIVLILLLILLCCVLPLRMFWIGYLILSFHLSRLSTSLMLSCLVMNQPKQSLFRNMGTLTSVYSKKHS